MTWQLDDHGAMHAHSGEGDYRVSTAREELDLDVVHGFLCQTYWSPGIPREVVQRAIESSFTFGLYTRERAQIGFARVITDFATFAYLADVFVLEAYRQRGLGKFLVGSVMTHPRLDGLRRWVLATRDAHRLYQQYGFKPLSAPTTFMEKFDPEIYSK